MSGFCTNEALILILSHTIENTSKEVYFPSINGVSVKKSLMISFSCVECGGGWERGREIGRRTVIFMMYRPRVPFYL
jgi:hypothetical protein